MKMSKNSRIETTGAVTGKSYIKLELCSLRKTQEIYKVWS